MRVAHNALLRAGMSYARVRHWRPVERMARRPDDAQRNVLKRLMAANRDTRFGREHGYDSIRDHATFQARVPVQEYESLRPYIDEQRRTGTPALTSESPVFYAQTSGTTSRPKHIPVTPSMLAMHRHEQALFSYLQFRACPDAFAGKALGIMGAASEGHLDSGHIVGSVSGHLYQSLPHAVRSRFVVPPEVFGIADYELKYLVILRLALAEPRVTYLGAPNPSTFVRLLDILNEQRELLLESLATGRLPPMEGADPDLRDLVAHRLAPDPRRAARLRSEPVLTFATVWPEIRLVTTWTGGSCGIALEGVRRKLPTGAIVMELGYQSTECRGTIALEPETPAGLPALHHHYLEFAEQSAWDEGRRECLTLGQLVAGRRYYVLFTTIAGLCRYFMNDLVEVTGFFHRTPLLRFVQKGRGVTSLTGEKLYEAQVIEAVQQAAAQRGLTLPFFVLVADEHVSGYCLYAQADESIGPDADAMGRDVDERLAIANLEYQGKRSSGRLKPLSFIWLKAGTGEAYKAAAVRSGQREGQFKLAVLQYRKDVKFPFDSYAVR
jgi:hypothetical protein